VGPIARIWVAFAALGAGLIHIALALGAPLPLGVPLAIVGLVEFGWGVMTFARDRAPFVRTVILVAVVPVIAWGLLLVTVGPPLPFVPMGIAALLELLLAALLAIGSRRASEHPRSVPGTRRYIVGFAAAGLVVGVLTSVALGAAQAGPGPAPSILPSHDSH
jgi:hypothetical protein